MKKIIIYVVFFLCITWLSFADQAETAREEISRREPILEKEAEDLFRISSYEEYSWVQVGSRKGYWNLLVNHIAYLNQNIPAAYFDFTIHDRLKEIDYTFDAGTYLKFKNGYFHSEAGFGEDVDYIYKFKALAEIEHKLIGNLNANIDTRYRHYDTGAVYILSPGLVYYFGNNYISADYGISFTEKRDTAQFGTLRTFFSPTDYLQLWGGVSLGERLYDIIPRKSEKQKGYIFFAGTDLIISKHIKFSAGFSYAEEEPSFIKRSINFQVDISF